MIRTIILSLAIFASLAGCGGAAKTNSPAVTTGLSEHDAELCNIIGDAPTSEPYEGYSPLKCP